MKKHIFYVLVIILVLFIIYGTANLITTPGKYDEFAKCLTEKGVIMYGTDWCPHCRNQKAMFGKSFRYVNYVNCEVEKAKCDIAGIRAYPTWIINGKTYLGTRDLIELANLSGCRINVEKNYFG